MLFTERIGLGAGDRAAACAHGSAPGSRQRMAASVRPRQAGGRLSELCKAQAAKISSPPTPRIDLSQTERIERVLHLALFVDRPGRVGLGVFLRLRPRPAARSQLWSACSRSETLTNFAPSHSSIQAPAWPVWLSQEVENGAIMPVMPISASLASSILRFSRPQRSCSALTTLVLKFACARLDGFDREHRDQHAALVEHPVELALRRSRSSWDRATYFLMSCMTGASETGTLQDSER